MKRKSLLLRLFLLALFISPMIFISSYTNASTIPTEQTMNQDFALSVLSDPHFATGGAVGFDNTYVVDTVYFAPFLGTEIIEFDYPFEYRLEYFTYAVYGKSDSTTSLYYNDDGEAAWTNHFVTIDTDLEWSNGTEYDMSTLADIATSETFYIYFDFGCDIDYIEISFGYSDGAWYSNSWDYRKMILIDGAVGAGTDYSISLNVTYNVNMKSDFGDIRFADNDGITLLDFWLEKYSAEAWAICWVEVSDNLDSNQDIYMYYGNDAVSTTSNGTNTFLFFDDFENNNMDRWTTVGAYWSASVSQVKRGTYAGYADANSVTGDRFLTQDISAFDDRDIMIHMWGRSEVETSIEYWTRSSDTNVGNAYPLKGDLDDWKYDNGPYGEWEANTNHDDTWYELELAVDYSNEYFRFWLGGVSKGAIDLEDVDGNDITEMSSLVIIVDSGANEDIWIDDFYVRNYVYVEPVVDSFGEEEEKEPAVWQNISTVIIYLRLDISTGLLESLLIFLGLIMIPASTLYLVKGGKSEMSSDKLFYGLIAFVIGWALVIGGIYA